MFAARGFPVLFNLELLASSSLMVMRFVVDKVNLTFLLGSAAILTMSSLQP